MHFSIADKFSWLTDMSGIVDGKVKASLRRGFRWIKAKCSELISGWWSTVWVEDAATICGELMLVYLLICPKMWKGFTV
jgi:Domain of unknown function (DUF3511)